jgi:hypothetical protein
VNLSVLARTEDTPARRNSLVGAVSHDVKRSDAGTCAQYTSIGGEIRIDSPPKIVNAHAHRSRTPTELRSRAGMSREVNKWRGNASVIVALVWRTTELVAMTRIQRGKFWHQLMMKRRSPQQRRYQRLRDDLVDRCQAINSKILCGYQRGWYG